LLKTILCCSKDITINQKKTAECFAGDWYLTGDLAMMDEAGYIWFESRADDICKSSGYRIGPFEVESVVDSHKAVLESAMIPSPDLMRGEIVKVFVVLKEGYEPSDELVKEYTALCQKGDRPI